MDDKAYMLVTWWEDDNSFPAPFKTMLESMNNVIFCATFPIARTLERSARDYGAINTTILEVSSLPEPEPPKSVNNLRNYAVFIQVTDTGDDVGKFVVVSVEAKNADQASSLASGIFSDYVETDTIFHVVEIRLVNSSIWTSETPITPYPYLINREEINYG